MSKYLPLIMFAVLLTASISLFYFYSKNQQKDCLTQENIDADVRCLYVYQGEVYNFGTREKPHKGHACGINVDNIMPKLHFVGNVFAKFTQTRVAPFCEAPKTITINWLEVTKPVIFISLAGLLISIYLAFKK